MRDRTGQPGAQSGHACRRAVRAAEVHAVSALAVPLGRDVEARRRLACRDGRGALPSVAAYGSANWPVATRPGALRAACGRAVSSRVARLHRDRAHLARWNLRRLLGGSRQESASEHEKAAQPAQPRWRRDRSARGHRGVRDGRRRGDLRPSGECELEERQRHGRRPR